MALENGNDINRGLSAQNMMNNGPGFRPSINNNNPRSNISFMDNGRMDTTRRISVNIEIPRSFFDILGPGQARVEIEGVKRDVSAIANWRIQDAIGRKIAGNHDLLHENNLLKTAISNLQHIIVNNNKHAEVLQIENNRLNALLEMTNSSVQKEDTRPNF